MKALDVADVVLRHGARRAGDAMEQGLGAEANDLGKLALDGRENHLVAGTDNLRVPRPAEERPHESLLRRSSSGELGMNEGRGKQPPSFPVGNKKAEARWQRGGFRVIAERHSNRGAVRDF